VHPIALGVDIVEVSRIGDMLARHRDRFTSRCFTDAERGYCDAAPKLRDQRYAARFAAKEAVLKALGTGWSAGIGWRDVELVRLPTGEPAISLHARADAVARRRGIVRWLVSISHTDAAAIASAIGLDG